MLDGGEVDLESNDDRIGVHPGAVDVDDRFIPREMERREDKNFVKVLEQSRETGWFAGFCCCASAILATLYCYDTLRFGYTGN